MPPSSSYLYLNTYEALTANSKFWYNVGYKCFFFFGALPIDTLKIKHEKKLKEISSRHALETLPEKASINAFIH